MEMKHRIWEKHFQMLKLLSNTTWEICSTYRVSFLPVHFSRMKSHCHTRTVWHSYFLCLFYSIARCTPLFHCGSCFSKQTACASVLDVFRSVLDFAFCQDKAGEVLKEMPRWLAWLKVGFGSKRLGIMFCSRTNCNV